MPRNGADVTDDSDIHARNVHYHRAVHVMRGDGVLVAQVQVTADDRNSPFVNLAQVDVQGLWAAIKLVPSKSLGRNRG